MTIPDKQPFISQLPQRSVESAHWTHLYPQAQNKQSQKLDIYTQTIQQAHDLDCQ